MTPEQRAEQITLQCRHEIEIGEALPTACEDCIATALQPSAAVKELLTAADELRTIVQFDGTTKTPRYDRAATAVREELGL